MGQDARTFTGETKGGLSAGLSSNALKLIACAAMFGDHAAKAWGATGILRVILTQVTGRIAFPMFCFFLAEGFSRSRDRKAYLLRMVIFACLAELPFNMAIFGRIWYPRHQNTLFSLSLGLVMFFCLHAVEKRGSMRIEAAVAAQCAIVAGFAAAAQLLEVDYHARGLICMGIFYLLRNQQRVFVTALGSLSINIPNFNNAGAFLSAIPLSAYDGRRGRADMKYFFYVFYPAHLLVLHLLKGIVRA